MGPIFKNKEDIQSCTNCCGSNLWAIQWNSGRVIEDRLRPETRVSESVVHARKDDWSYFLTWATGGKVLWEGERSIHMYLLA